MSNPQGLVNTSSVNETTGKHVRNVSTFDESLSYRMYNTARFGDYTPTFVMEGVPTDEISLNSKDLVDSLSLTAPFKGQIRKIKESFCVPNSAILPMNWDRIYVQPSNGDDVPVDANCVISDFPSLFAEDFSGLLNSLGDRLSSPANFTDDFAVSEFLTGLLRTLVLGEYVYSTGSLLNVLGYKANAQFCFVNKSNQSYDLYMTTLLSNFFTRFATLTVNVPSGSSVVAQTFRGLGQFNADGNYYDWHRVSSFRALLEVFRENPACKIVDFRWADNHTLDTFKSSFCVANASITKDSIRRFFYNDSYSFLPSDYYGIHKFFLPQSSVDSDDLTSLSQKNLNLSRILAYQLVCAHYYSNSSIDFVYSAELYRQYIRDLSDPVLSHNASLNYFYINGRNYGYDYLSGNLLKRVLLLSNDGSGDSFYAGTDYDYSDLVSSWSVGNEFLSRLCVYAGIFGFRKSLRYGDYFVGARPRPLAPINTDVAVNNGAVSVVDVTRNIQAQRFANAVMRSRSKIEEYVNSLFGKRPAVDYHNPLYLSQEIEMVFGDEVQGTGDDIHGRANSRVANFATGMNQYTFTFHNDDAHPCIYLQIVSFDIKRAYTRSIDRQFFHADRYDMFNPDFQYIGDQPVYGAELGYEYGSKLPAVFGYQSRDMEYKQRFDVVSGGFVNDLPGWVLTDQDRSKYMVPVINSDFIRSYNAELDQFYVSLTGYTLGTYFHFMLITNNNVKARRPMAVDPQILG